MKEKWIYFDLDGTIADLYGVENWLSMLRAENPFPYVNARPLVNMNVLARKLNKLVHEGWHIGVISWLSKCSSPSYDKAVTAAKIKWLKTHLKSVSFEEINIVAYGVNKWEVCGKGILFDDEDKNRETWGGKAYHPSEMMEVLSSLLA